MTDALLSDDDVESALSIAYVHAVAALAGYTCGEPPGPDRDSVDIQVSAGGHMRPKVDFQLKASIALTGDLDNFNYPLKMKNYNDLRVPTQTPRALIVLDLPRDPSEWLKISVDEMIIKRAAYWCSLAGLPEVTNATKKTIYIPRANVFDVDALKRMMECSRRGRLT